MRSANGPDSAGLYPTRRTNLMTVANDMPPAMSQLLHVSFSSPEQSYRILYPGEASGKRERGPLSDDEVARRSKLDDPCFLQDAQTTPGPNKVATVNVGTRTPGPWQFSYQDARLSHRQRTYPPVDRIVYKSPTGVSKDRVPLVQ